MAVVWIQAANVRFLLSSFGSLPELQVAQLGKKLMKLKLAVTIIPKLMLMSLEKDMEWMQQTQTYNCRLPVNTYIYNVYFICSDIGISLVIRSYVIKSSATPVSDSELGGNMERLSN